jgi:hypothetical protein
MKNSSKEEKPEVTVLDCHEKRAHLAMAFYVALGFFLYIPLCIYLIPGAFKLCYRKN